MGAFEYLAYDPKGKERKGVLEGDSARQIRQQLREQGLLPLSVDAVTQKEGIHGQGVHLRRGISAGDLALLTRQLATLTRAGLPLDEAASTVARQTEKPRLKRLMMGVRARVLEGHALAEGMAGFPHVFSELYRSTVEAGEQSGHLDAVLERLADYTEERHKLQQRIQLALLYPVIVSVLSIFIVSFLLAYVVPEIVSVFDNIDQELPFLIVALIAVSDFLRENYLLLIGLVIAVIVGFSYAQRKPGPRRQLHHLMLRIPIISRLTRGVNTARFSRTLSILAASGVPVLEALRIASQVIINMPMRSAVEEAALRVREGANLASSLEHSGYFPPMVTNLIASGEVSGNLEDMLERASITQERELETTISTIMGLLEPLMIVAMGGVVLIIVLAILLPIFDLNQLVR